MATGTISFLPEGAILSDGSASNNACGLTRRAGTEAVPKKFFVTADFDPATKESCFWKFIVPQNYLSGGTLRILWIANTITNSNVVWLGAVACITPADVDTPYEHAFSADASVTTGVNTTEANRLVVSLITLNVDNMAAGDIAFIRLARDAANVGDTTSVDASVLAVSFEYAI